MLIEKRAVSLAPAPAAEAGSGDARPGFVTSLYLQIIGF